MINTKLSQDIYKILIHGKIINRRCYDPVRNAFAEDELFQELSSQYEGENGYRACTSASAASWCCAPPTPT